MKFITIRRFLLVMLASAMSLATFSTPAAAAPPTAVDFTVSEVFPIGTPGVVTISDIPGCASGTVSTPTVESSQRGRRTTFTGTKVVDCGDGDTFTMWFTATGVECRATNRGRWVITDGTGAFDGARGRGRLIGSYVSADGTPGDFCNSAGVDDRYVGRIRLAPPIG